MPCERIVRVGAEKSDHRHRRLLRARHERPRGGGAAEERDELAPPHSITSSASASSLSVAPGETRGSDTDKNRHRISIPRTSRARLARCRCDLFFWLLTMLWGEDISV